MPAHRPKIAILITRANIGGAQIHVLDLMQSLRASYEFVLITGEEAWLTQQCREQGFAVQVLAALQREISPRQDWRAIGEIRALLRQLQPDLLHAHSSKAGVLGRIAAKLERVPALFTAHGWAFSQGAPGMQRIYALGVEWAMSWLGGGTVLISEHDRRLAKRLGLLRAGKNWLARNGVRPLPVEVKNKRQTDLPVILTVGRLSWVKSHALLLDALAQVQQPFQAKIIGTGDYEARLKQQCRELGLGDKLQFLDEVEDCSHDFLAADVFVLSSHYEGLPLSVLEAMSAALPVVSTRVCGVPEAVIEGETGLLTAPGDARDLAAKLELLLSSAALRTRLGEAGYQRFQQHFQADTQVAAMQRAE